MKLKEAIDVIDEMADYISENWDDEDKIDEYCKAVDIIKKSLGKTKVVGTLNIDGKVYSVCE